MAQRQGWAVVMALLAGLVVGTLFWVYGPFSERQVARQVAEALKDRKFTLEVDQGSRAALEGAASQALGGRFYLVTDGNNTFLADLQQGRVWRYFYHAKAGPKDREEEGFLPLPILSGGKKFLSALELEHPPAPGPAPAKGRVKGK
jgi:hypothetical protein